MKLNLISLIAAASLALGTPALANESQADYFMPGFAVEGTLKEYLSQNCENPLEFSIVKAVNPKIKPENCHMLFDGKINNGELLRFVDVNVGECQKAWVVNYMGRERKIQTKIGDSLFSKPTCVNQEPYESVNEAINQGRLKGGLFFLDYKYPRNLNFPFTEKQIDEFEIKIN